MILSLMRKEIRNKQNNSDKILCGHLFNFQNITTTDVIKNVYGNKIISVAKDALKVHRQNLSH